MATFGVDATLLAWTVLAYLGGGLVARRRWPESRLGHLMTLIALALASGPLRWSPDEVALAVGHLLDAVAQVLFLHLVLAVPTGRLTGRGERPVVVAAYAAAVTLEAAGLLAGDHGPRNLVGLPDEPGLAGTLRTVQLSTLAGCLLVGVTFVVGRWRRRRGTAWQWVPVLLGGGAVTLAAIALLDLMVAWGGSAAGGTRELRWVVLLLLGAAPVAILAGVLESRLARSAVGDLLPGLAAHPTPAALREALARAVHDPSLRLLYWLPEQRVWAGPDGEPAPLPAGDDGRTATVIDAAGEPVAALVHDRSLLAEPELLGVVSAAAAMSLENARLHAELRRRVREVSESRRRVLETGQRERRRLERNLHDGAQQRLVSVALEAGLLATSVCDPEAARRLGLVKAEIGRSIDELRAVARGIHPAVLGGHGLGVALESLAAGASVPVRLDVTLEERPPEAVEVVAHHVVREALRDAAGRAGLTAAAVAVRRRGAVLTVEVDHDGAGDAAGGPGQDGVDGPRLQDLTDRVEAVGGHLHVRWLAGTGLQLRAELPHSF